MAFSLMSMTSATIDRKPFRGLLAA